MKWTLFGLTAAACLFTTEQSFSGSYYRSGNDLWDMCQKNKDVIANFYIQGAQDGIELYRELLDLEPFICNPKNSHSMQAADIVCKYLRDNPENRHYSAPTAVINALSNAWPRGKRGNKQ